MLAFAAPMQAISGHRATGAVVARYRIDEEAARPAKARLAGRAQALVVVRLPSRSALRRRAGHGGRNAAAKSKQRGKNVSA